MAKRPILRGDKETIEGSFLDVVVPKFDWIKVNLTHNLTKWVESKTEILDRVDHDYSISINLSDKVPNEDRELSKAIQEACKMNFSIYRWRDKQYYYYTTSYTGTTEDKKSVLQNLFGLLEDYELKKTAKLNESAKVFEEDKNKNLKCESADMVMKFHEPTQRFVVLAKAFLGGEKFNFLRNHSEYWGKLVAPEAVPPDNINERLISSDFFAEDVSVKKIDGKAYFIVSPGCYDDIRVHFNLEEKKKQEFIETQKQVSSEHDLSQYNVTEDNVFGLKIKFVPEIQCFEFYGKGYEESSSYYGRAAPRTLLALWALNFIYAKDKVEGEFKYPEHEMMVDKDKIEFEVVPGGSKREKNTRVPASEWEKMRLIKENFEKENQFWSRPEKSIKITHCELSGLNVFSRYPAVYFDKKGECYLCFGMKRTGNFKAIGENGLYGNSLPPLDDYLIEDSEVSSEPQKKKREAKFSQTIKAIPISFVEANYYLNEHPFSEYIKRGSLILNARVHGDVNKMVMGQEEIQETYDTVYLFAKIYNETKQSDNVKPKAKRLKL